MVCPKCGTENNYYHKFCYECGAVIQSGDTPIEPDRDNDLEVPSPIVFHKGAYESGFPVKNRIFRTVVSVAIVIVAALGIFLLGTNLLRKGSEDSYSEKNSVPPVATPAPTYIAADTAIPSASATPTATPRPASPEPTILVSASATTEVDKTTLLPDVTLALSDNQTLSTADSSIILKGKTDANASVTVVSDLGCKTPVTVAPDGSFSIDFDLPVIPGQYSVEIKASATEYRDASLPCVIEKLIDEKAYQTAAVACKFDTLVNSPESYKGKVLTISGIVDALDTADTNKFTFLVDKKTSQRIYVEYTGNTKMSHGAARRLYGEYIDIYNGMPHVLVRMAFKIAAADADPWEPVG